MAGRQDNAAKGILETVRGPLPATLVRSSKAIAALPEEEDFHYYRNFRSFGQPISAVQSQVSSLLSQFLKSEWPEDVADSFDWLVNVQDDLLERVDSALDAHFTAARSGDGQLKPSSAGAAQQVGKWPGAGWGKSANKWPSSLFHPALIARPQEKFDLPVDNSNAPFQCIMNVGPIPAGTSANEPIRRAAAGGTSDAAAQVVIGGHPNSHPLQEKLMSMEFEPWQLEVTTPRLPAGLDETPVSFVDSPEQLANMAVVLKAAREIAVDLENHHYRSFQGFVCLMQVSTREQDFLVDTLALRSRIGPLLGPIFADASLLKVMHGADRDIVWLQRDFGIFVANLFDTGQAARVLGLPSFGLAHLLEHFCQVHADKRYQLADWRVRPLPTEMFKYAREDTHHLLYIYDRLKALLAEVQPTQVPTQAQQQWSPYAQLSPMLQVLYRSRDLCLSLYEKEQLTETSFEKLYRRSGKSLTPRQLSVFKALHAWRSRVARAEDESTGYVLSNNLLFRLVEEAPTRAKKLHSILNRSAPLVAQKATDVINIISKALQEEVVLSNQPTTAPSASLQRALVPAGADAAGVSIKEEEEMEDGDAEEVEEDGRAMEEDIVVEEDVDVDDDGDVAKMLTIAGQDNAVGPPQHLEKAAVVDNGEGPRPSPSAAVLSPLAKRKTSDKEVLEPVLGGKRHKGEEPEGEGGGGMGEEEEGRGEVIGAADGGMLPSASFSAHVGVTVVNKKNVVVRRASVSSFFSSKVVAKNKPSSSSLASEAAVVAEVPEEGEEGVEGRRGPQGPTLVTLLNSSSDSAAAGQGMRVLEVATPLTTGATAAAETCAVGEEGDKRAGEGHKESVEEGLSLPLSAMGQAYSQAQEGQGGGQGDKGQGQGQAAGSRKRPSAMSSMMMMTMGAGRKQQRLGSGGSALFSAGPIPSTVQSSSSVVKVGEESNFGDAVKRIRASLALPFRPSQPFPSAAADDEAWPSPSGHTAPAAPAVRGSTEDRLVADTAAGTSPGNTRNVDVDVDVERGEAADGRRNIADNSWGSEALPWEEEIPLEEEEEEDRTRGAKGSEVVVEDGNDGDAQAEDVGGGGLVLPLSVREASRLRPGGGRSQQRREGADGGGERGPSEGRPSGHVQSDGHASSSHIVGEDKHHPRKGEDKGARKPKSGKVREPIAVTAYDYSAARLARGIVGLTDAGQAVGTEAVNEESSEDEQEDVVRGRGIRGARRGGRHPSAAENLKEAVKVFGSDAPKAGKKSNVFPRSGNRSYTFS